MADCKTPLESNCYYHVYNHAVGNENLFRNARNYLYFIAKMEKYLIAYMDIYCFCLMPNHFHFIVKIKPNGRIISEYLNTHNKSKIAVIPECSKIISMQFSNLFNSYAQSYNKENMRKGSLFYNRFKRKKISSNIYLKTLILYIHNNPTRTGLVNDPKDWPYSSYKEISSNNNSWIQRREVIELFDDLENFKFCQRTPS